MKLQLGLPKGNPEPYCVEMDSYRVEIEPGGWGIEPGGWGIEARRVNGEAKDTILKITPPKEMRVGDLEHIRLWVVRGEGENEERTSVSTRAGLKKELTGWVFVPSVLEGWVTVGMNGGKVR